MFDKLYQVSVDGATVFKLPKNKSLRCSHLLIWFLSWPQLFVQADWKPESPDRFGDIAELVKSIGSLNVVETKPQGCSRLEFSSAVDCGFGF